MDHAKAKEALLTVRRMEFINAKPSQQIRMAIDDLKAVRRNPNVKFDMAHWVKQKEEGSCFVCVAGAVMTQRFDALNYIQTALKPEMSPSSFLGQTIIKELPYRATLKLTNSLVALNHVRTGCLSQAAVSWELDAPAQEVIRKYGSEDDHPTLSTSWFRWLWFGRAMTELEKRANIFELAGA